MTTLSCEKQNIYGSEAGASADTSNGFDIVRFRISLSFFSFIRSPAAVIFKVIQARQFSSATVDLLELLRKVILHVVVVPVVIPLLRLVCARFLRRPLCVRWNTKLNNGERRVKRRRKTNRRQQAQKSTTAR